MNTQTNLVLVLAAGLLAGCHRKNPAAPDPSEPRIQGDRIVMSNADGYAGSISVQSAAKGTRGNLHFNGRLTWDDDVTVRVFTPFAGRVMKILVETGRTVERKTPLALIASPDFGQAQADARRAETDFRLTERVVTRLRELYEHGAAPKKDLDTAEADMARARSERERTARRLEFYGGSTTNVDQVYPLQSPLTGVVVEKNINPGQEVRPDQMLANAPQFFSPLFVITDPARLWVQLDVTESDLAHLKAAQPIVLRSQAWPDQTFRGRLEVVSESLDPTTRTVKVRGSVDNSKRLLKAEMFVTVALEAAEVAEVTVPAKAVILRGDRHFVFREEQPGTYRRCEVKIGGEQSGNVIVRDGLQTGDRIVCEGSLLLEQVFQSVSGS